MVIPSGMVIDWSALHLEKVPPLKVVNPLGMVTEARLLIKSALAKCGDRVGYGHRGEPVTTFEGIAAYRDYSFSNGH